MHFYLQVKKLQDRVAKAKDEVQKTKEKYEQSLREINEYNPKYMEDMTTVFEKCQEFEEKRLKFFKEMLFSIHSCLNISNMPDVIRIYEEYRHTIQSADASKDLKYWSNTHGVGMAMNWPIFEVRTLLCSTYSLDDLHVICVCRWFTLFSLVLFYLRQICLLD